MQCLRNLVACLLALAIAPALWASGHGPVFGLATPTNIKGGWSLDLGTMSRFGAEGSGAMTRAMLAYGVTPDLQISVSAPVVFSSASLLPGRLTAMMPASGDFEVLGAWRFQRRDFGVGSRFETTAYAGLVLPGAQTPSGLLGQLNWAPGAVGMIATGLASRSTYFWIGIGGEHFAESGGDRRPGMLMYSAVWGYRPKPFRRPYPHWDGRFFIEMNGEDSSRVRHNGVLVPGTDGQQIFLGPTTLWIYKNYGIEAGIEFPIYRNTGPAFPHERFRVAVDFSYFF